MKKFALILAVFSTLTACAQVPYKVTVPVPEVADGTMVYMTNYDSGEKIDSVAAKAEKAFFTGDIDEPVVVRFVSGDRRYGTSILEQGASTINQKTGMGVGSMLNDQLQQRVTELDGIAEQLQSAQSQEQMQSLYNKYLATEKAAIEENIDNPIGYFLFIDYANNVPTDEMLAFVEKYPNLKEYARVQKLLEGSKRVMATSPGQPYTDFEVTYNGTTQKLSDYMEPGKYLLVDFWASWCGPCRREMSTLKDLYSEYHDKGLNVLGVAVWDKPQDTEAAIKQLALPWPCIINSQTIATDLYGIPAIPCVILIGPDGKILSRGLQGEKLKEEVAKYLNK